MGFSYPQYLFLGFLLFLVMLIAFIYFQKRREKLLKLFVSQKLFGFLLEDLSLVKRKLKYALLMLAVVFICVALARVQIGEQWQEIQRKGIDIVFAIDTSKSMLADDIKPSRFERTKLGIIDFVERLNGDRVALIAFAGSAYLTCPFTLDYGAFLESLKELEVGIIPRGGTDISSAIKEAGQSIINDQNKKILIILSDGEDLEGDAEHLAAEALKKGIIIYTVGVGTSNGELIRYSEEGKSSAFVKDAKGQVVKSRLDEETLKKIAEAGGGIYQALGENAEGLDHIYRKKLSLLPKSKLAERREKVSIEHFQLPLLLALTCLVLEFLLSEKKNKFRKYALERTKNPFPIFFLAKSKLTSTKRLLANTMIGRMFQSGSKSILLLVLLLSVADKSYSSPKSAEEAYRKAEYEKALIQYQEALQKAPEDVRLKFNVAASAYKNRKYSDAVVLLQEAIRELVTAPNSTDAQSRAYYNLGNSLYRLGQSKEENSPDEAIKDWKKAVESYDGALKLNPKDENAKFNKGFVEQKLKELEKKQEEKKSESSNSNTNSSNQSSQQQNSDGNSSQQSSGGESSSNKDGQQSSQTESDNKQSEGQQSSDTQSKDGEQDNEQEKSSGVQKQSSSNESESSEAYQTASETRDDEMSKEEAKALLESLSEDELKMQIVPDTNKENYLEKDINYKDW